MAYPIPGFHEPVSSWTHLLGAGLFAVLSFPLLRRARHGRLFLLVYCLAIVSLFAISGTYHLLGPSDGRTVMLRIDMSAIFVLIVGTLTPVLGLFFRGWRRWVPITLLWLIAAACISLVCVFYGTIPRLVWICAQLGIGWFGGLVGVYLGIRYGWRYVRTLVYGGIAYTVGATINVIRWPTAIPGIVGPHEIFHFFVVAGAAYHWYFIYRATHPHPPKRKRKPVRYGDAGLDTGK